MIFDTDLKGAQARLTELLDQASCAVAFTGAGLSTECGIPDFRSPGGLWTQNKPIPFDVFVAHKAARNEAWRRKFAMEEAFASARPGRGHRALARLHGRGRLKGIITQNIDGLHQASGVPDAALIELHGNGTYATCLECGTRYELEWVKARFEASGGSAPDCPECGGPIKAATISFGQAMPETEMARADELTRQCDLFIVIGSSLVVFPAAGFPLKAKKKGARLVILNREPTDFDDMADLVVRIEIGDLLAPFAQDA
ncbi:SIR2 family NAD-dependent protein deacylase [Xanthobacter oligotrophicus]|uniref:SIR2 family NAD-dependent protein deacylase n=1 Tax=Xanthobacter oligotrophicus TaxID=2607286 RepID=UPI0011F2D279|nr:Sir2 family NAD-dependent protein deacetylase [Xanthobacter oligotrophicus]MCG5233937.1 Sir2 family NAD-dependent protein deacetylase [Xanthobacter oligotrophicus]